MAEMFPLACGVLVGATLGVLRPRRGGWLAVLLSVLLGCAATVISGEFRISWDYLLIDIPLVAVSSAGAYLLIAVPRRRRTSSG
jgi:hypothetical protein